MAMLEKEFQYYVDNQEELVKKYDGKYIVIIGEEVIGDYVTEMEAYEACEKQYELGTFLIQQVQAGEDNITQTFHSRVIFS